MFTRFIVLTAVCAALAAPAVRAEEINPVVGKVADFTMREADLDRLIGGDRRAGNQLIRCEERHRPSLARACGPVDPRRAIVRSRERGCRCFKNVNSLGIPAVLVFPPPQLPRGALATRPVREPLEQFAERARHDHAVLRLRLHPRRTDLDDPGAERPARKLALAPSLHPGLLLHLLAPPARGPGHLHDDGQTKVIRNAERRIKIDRPGDVLI